MALDDDKKPDDKKARVLHTRVPESLEDEIKRRAETLGISVSNLVRNVLHNTFGLVGSIVSDGAEVARLARGEQEPPAPAVPTAGPVPTARPVPTAGPVPTAEPAAANVGAPTVRVLGWQAVVLNLNALCERCNAILKKGSTAMIGVLDGPGARPIVCADCVAREVRQTEGESS